MFLDLYLQCFYVKWIIFPLIFMDYRISKLIREMSTWIEFWGASKFSDRINFKVVFATFYHTSWETQEYSGNVPLNLLSDLFGLKIQTRTALSYNIRTQKIFPRKIGTPLKSFHAINIKDIKSLLERLNLKYIDIL